MIQPIRCFTCGRVVADQIDYYNRKKDELIKKIKIKKRLNIFPIIIQKRF